MSEPKPFFQHTVVRRLLRFVLLPLAALVLIVLIFSRFYLSGWLEGRLETAVSQASAGLYSLEMEDFSVNPLTGSAATGAIHLRTDSLIWERLRAENPESRPMRIDLQADGFLLSRLHWLRYLRTRHVDLDVLSMDRPRLNIVTLRDSVLQVEPEADSLTKRVLDRLPELLAPRAESLRIGRLEVKNGTFTAQTLHRRGKQTRMAADSIDWMLEHVNVTPDPASTVGRALYADNIRLRLKHFSLFTPAGVYGYRIDELEVIGKDDQVEMHHLAVIPLVSGETFTEKQHFRKEFLRFSAERLFIRGLDLFRALHREQWTMRSMRFDKARLEVFLDRDLPMKPEKKMPHELVRDIPYFFNIDSIHVRNSYVGYTEVVAGNEGRLDFENTNATVLNLTNDRRKRLSGKAVAHVFATTRMLGKGDLSLDLLLPLLDREFNCSYTAKLGPMSLTHLNELLEEKDFIRIDEGDVESVTIHAKVLDGTADGNVEAIYKNLKISVLDRNKDGKKKKLVSALANFLIRGKNVKDSKGKPFKEGKIAYSRTPEDGMLRFIWQSARTGLMQTMLPPGMELKPKVK
jgi:hypothetical protein